MRDGGMEEMCGKGQKQLLLSISAVPSCPRSDRIEILLSQARISDLFIHTFCEIEGEQTAPIKFDLSSDSPSYTPRYSVLQSSEFRVHSSEFRVAVAGSILDCT